jgi:hypothetical protein
MILRPDNSDELLTLIESVLIDGRLQPDTRALLASLFCRRNIEFFPLIADLGERAGAPIGPERARRMLNEMRAAGYVLRAFWAVPYTGKRPNYTSLAGSPGAIAIAAAKFSIGMRTPGEARNG